MKLPSKGIAVYSYISVEGYVVEVETPKLSVITIGANSFVSKDLEMESTKLKGRVFSTGRFE